MTSIAKIKPQRYTFKTLFMKENKNLYDAAEKLFREGTISSSIMHTLKAVIATRHMKWPTLKQINDARTRSCARKFAQADTVTEKTISRHLTKLEKLQIIERHVFFYSWGYRSEIIILETLHKLAVCHEDMRVTSISSSSSHERGGGANNKNNTKQSIQHTAAAASPGPDGPAAATVSDESLVETKSWQDEMRERYEQEFEAKFTPQEGREHAKKQFRALRGILGGKG